MKRILSFLLAAVMMLGFIGCAVSTDDSESTSDTYKTQAAEIETSEKDLLGFEYKTFNGEFTFGTQDTSVGWGTKDIYQDEDSAEPLESAVFNRNLWIKDNFGCEIKQIASSDLGDAAKQQIKSGTSDYDAYAGPVNKLASMSVNGYLKDLLGDEVPYIDLTHDWWDDKTVNGLSIEGKLYYATGDIVTYDDDATFILMFNKTLLNNHVATGEIKSSPYEYVGNKEWTFEMFHEMMKTTCKGDDSGRYDYKTDSFGLAGGQEMVIAFYYASGLTTAGYNDSGDIVFDMDINKSDDYFVWAHNVIYNNAETVVFHEASGEYTSALNCFTDGRSLFYGEVLAQVGKLRAYDLDFGIVPFPKYDTNQDSYYTYVNNVGNFVAVPSNTPNDEKSGMILEAMAFKSKTTLTPAYYDINLIAKGTRDEESEPMLDLIRSNRIYDLGYVFGWGYLVDRTFIDVAKKGGGIASKAAKYRMIFERDMEKTIKAYTE